MLVIIRIHSKESIEPVWDEIIKNQDRLQKVHPDRCHILYLTKRMGFHNELSLFVEAADRATLSELIVSHLSKIKGIDGFVVHHLYRARFYPLPQDTGEYKRFTINLKVDAPYLPEVYKKLTDPNIPEGMKKVYFAYTFHSSTDSMQLSLLCKSEDTLREYVGRVIDKLPGVLKTTVFAIESTKPFISYETWQKFAEQNPAALDWTHLRGHK